MSDVKTASAKRHTVSSLAVAGLLCGLSQQALAAGPAAQNVTVNAKPYTLTAANVLPNKSSSGFFDGVGQQLSDWQVVLGVGAKFEPEYEGGDKLAISPFPLIYAKFGDRVTLKTTGLDVDVLKLQDFSFGIHGGYETGRDEKDSDDLDGMGDVKMGGVLGLYAKYELGPVEFSAELDKTLGGSKGLTGKLGAEVSHRWNKFTFAAGASTTWADSNHMDSYFGVTTTQSARSGYARYDADAGFKRFDLETSVTYLAGDNWLLRGQVGVGFLIGDAADSPIVKDEIQPSFMLSVGYKF